MITPLPHTHTSEIVGQFGYILESKYFIEVALVWLLFAGTFFCEFGLQIIITLRVLRFVC